MYVSLFQLGNTAAGVATDVSNGGAIVNAYVLSLFGQPGQFILAAIITLACFTTAVGLISACSDFFHNLTGMSYQKLVVLLGAVCAVVANVGLSQLISLSIPVLVAIYPVAVALVLVTFLKSYFGRPRLVFRSVLLVAFLFGCLDGLGAAGMKMMRSPSCRCSTRAWPGCCPPCWPAAWAPWYVVVTSWLPKRLDPRSEIAKRPASAGLFCFCWIS